MASKRERKKQRDRTSSKQLKGLKLFQHLLTMASRQLDIQLIPEFNSVATDMPIMEWLEDLKLTCELCEITKSRASSATTIKKCGLRNISVAI